MKRIFVFIIVGLIMFGVGFGGGLVMGRSMASGGAASGNNNTRVAEPGPIVSLGEFTSNLAGAGRHIISFTASVEVLNVKATELFSSPGWLLRVKNEILLIVKDKIYEDLTSAEGALQFSEEIKRALNSQLPEIQGEGPVVRVLFETFVLQ